MTPKSTNTDPLVVRPRVATTKPCSLPAGTVVDLTTSPATSHSRFHATVPAGRPVWSAALKRSIDVAGAAVLLPFLAPGLLAIAAAVRLSSRGPVVFRQSRCGRDGTSFRICKFRTMSVDAEIDLTADPELHSKYQENDFKLSAEDDPRVTRLGALLRLSSLDELPQLWNVLRGEMSFVGPRPVIPSELALYGELRDDYESVRPGLTGPWQVGGRNEIRYPERAEIDADYARTWTISGDLRILAKTPLTLIRSEGVI